MTQAQRDYSYDVVVGPGAGAGGVERIRCVGGVLDGEVTVNESGMRLYEGARVVCWGWIGPTEMHGDVYVLKGKGEDGVWEGNVCTK